MSRDEAERIMGAAEGNRAIVRAIITVVEGANVSAEQALAIAEAVTYEERAEKASQEERIVAKLNRELRERKAWT